MEQAEIDLRMDWGMLPRDLICALQQLHTYMETDDVKYLLNCHEELVSMVEDLEDHPGLRDIQDLVVREADQLHDRIEKDDYLTIDQCGELQGMLEGLHIRILYETHPALAVHHPAGSR